MDNNIGGLLQQLDSARAETQFLAAQHADTLKGLHAEISALQLANRDLQFQLTFNKSPETSLLEQQIKELELVNANASRKYNELVSIFQLFL